MGGANEKWIEIRVSNPRRAALDTTVVNDRRNGRQVYDRIVLMDLAGGTGSVAVVVQPENAVGEHRTGGRLAAQSEEKPATPNRVVLSQRTVE